MISSEFAPGNSWLQQCNHWDPEAEILKTVANKMFPSMGLGMTSVLWWNSARSCKPDFATLITKERETLAFIPTNDASLKPFKTTTHHISFLYFFRYIHDSRLLDSDGRVHVVTQMLSSVDDSDGGTALSLLSINNVELSDRGNYTCKPASGGQASISLHVLEGNGII